MRSAEGRKCFRAYFESAITVPGPEVDELALAAREAGVYLIIGVIFRKLAAKPQVCKSRGGLW
jgi:nitrilase